jgi:hypothetical protein
MKILPLIAILFSTLMAQAETPPVWLASLQGASAVEADGLVGPPDLGKLERPTFLRIDPVAKEVTLLAPASRRGEVSGIDAIQRGEDGWILQGLEKGRAWTILVSDSGHLTLSAVTDGEVWAVFGNAIPLGEILPPAK